MSQEALEKSSQVDTSNPTSSTRLAFPRIQLTYESDEFEDIDKDDESLNKKKTIKKYQSTLRKRRTASLPVLNRHNSFSSEDSEKVTKIRIRDRQEALTIFNKILNLEYSNSEANESDKVVRIRRYGTLRRSIKIPLKLYKRIKILPTEDEIENQSGPVDLFTKLDMASRWVFPLAFAAVLIMYSLYFAFYLTDEWDKS